MIIDIQLSPGLRGDDLSLYRKAGDKVSLPCNNVVHQNCSSTTWTNNRVEIVIDIIEVVRLGVIKPPPNSAKNMILEPDCSLTIPSVRAEDAGKYTCQHYLSDVGQQHGKGTLVYLSVLTSEYLCFNSVGVQYRGMHMVFTDIDL